MICPYMMVVMHESPRALIICGDREWSDYETILAKMKELPRKTIIIHGAARGADYRAGVAAELLGLPCVSVPYIKKWRQGGGPGRNQVMLDLLIGLTFMGREVEVWAFHDHIEESRGTKNMLILARGQNVKTRTFRHAKLS